MKHKFALQLVILMTFGAPSLFLESQPLHAGVFSGAVAAAAAGVGHTCAITDEGVRCWGSNNYGQTKVPTDLINPTQITAGDKHTCAITIEGVRCWGGNTSGQTDVPNLTLSPRTLFDGIKCLKEFLYSEKHIFLDAVNKHSDTEGTVNEAFLFFALKPFFAAIDSSWAVKELHPDLSILIWHYHETFQTSSLSDFNRTPEYLTYSLNILSHALTSTRAMLTLEAQREVSEALLPALAEKLAKSELTPRDAEDIAALFTSHQLALTEMQSTPRLAPFAKMISELTNWLGDTHE